MRASPTPGHELLSNQPPRARIHQRRFPATMNAESHPHGTPSDEQRGLAPRRGPGRGEGPTERRDGGREWEFPVQFRARFRRLEEAGQGARGKPEARRRPAWTPSWMPHPPLARGCCFPVPRARTVGFPVSAQRKAEEEGGPLPSPAALGSPLTCRAFSHSTEPLLCCCWSRGTCLGSSPVMACGP